MRKVIIKNLSNVETHEARFSSLNEANTWVNSVKVTSAFGKIAGIYPIELLSEAELATEISRETNEFGYVFVTIPDQFTVEIEDITAQVQLEANRAKALKAVEYSNRLLAEIRLINLSKNLTVEQFMAIQTDSVLTQVKAFIMDTSFKTAKSYLNSYAGNAYTNEEKQQIINLLDEAIVQCD